MDHENKPLWIAAEIRNCLHLARQAIAAGDQYRKNSDELINKAYEAVIKLEDRLEHLKASI